MRMFFSKILSLGLGLQILIFDQNTALKGIAGSYSEAFKIQITFPKRLKCGLKLPHGNFLGWLWMLTCYIALKIFKSTLNIFCTSRFVIRHLITMNSPFLGQRSWLIMINNQNLKLVQVLIRPVLFRRWMAFCSRFFEDIFPQPFF